MKYNRCGACGVTPDTMASFCTECGTRLVRENKYTPPKTMSTRPISWEEIADGFRKSLEINGMLMEATAKTNYARVYLGASYK